jgi:DNA-binding transcriptional regulator YdaS (Cro superfamily)
MARREYDPLFDKIFKYGGGTQAEFARRINQDPRLITRWKYMNYIPASYALDVERVTRGLVTIRDVLELEERYRNAKTA